MDVNIFKKRFTYLKAEWGRGTFLLLVQLPDGYSSWVITRPKPGAKNFILDFHTVRRDEGLGPLSADFPGA